MRSSRPPPALRACDGCKRRKVKCDASIPCSNCHISHLTCAYTIPQRKRGPKVPGPRVSSPRPPTTPSSVAPEELATREPPFQGSNFDHGPSPTEPVAWWSPRTTDELPAVAEFPGSTTMATRTIQEGLCTSLKSAIPSMRPVDMVNHCIDLYMQYTFPSAPVVHEPTLRAAAHTFFSEPLSINHCDIETYDSPLRKRDFALVTALCASVASVMPDSMFPYPRNLLVKPFFNVSRDTLRSIEDYDLEHPNSASLAIRSLHSSALQHMTGKHRAAWHVQGQATLIALSLHLYSEQAVMRNEPLESQLLRHSFWQMYASDHVGASLRHRPCILHESLFHDDFTLLPFSEHPTSLLDPARPYYDEAFEEQLRIGFHLIGRVASSAAKLVFWIRKHGVVATEDDRGRLAQWYLDFTGILDDMPHWLHASNLNPSHNDSEAVQFHKRSFWVQRCTVMVTFHCLKLVILQQCIDSRLWDVVGLNNHPFALSMKKIEIVQDFLQTLDDIPFIYLQVKGEPNVCHPLPYHVQF